MLHEEHKPDEGTGRPTITALITYDLSKDIFGTASLITATTMSPIEAYRRLPAPMIQIHINWRAPLFSWSSAGTCGFKGTRRGTPFAAQTLVVETQRSMNKSMFD
ncbi:hypothetical protein AHAS_Ahas13G0319500 [Arachis hypogaea]